MSRLSSARLWRRGLMSGASQPHDQAENAVATGSGIRRMNPTIKRNSAYSRRNCRSRRREVSRISTRGRGGGLWASEPDANAAG